MVKPWIPVHPDYNQVNVVNESEKEDSILNLFKTLIALRKKYKPLRYGNITFLNRGEAGIIVYSRIYKYDAITIFLNFTSSYKDISGFIAAGFIETIFISGYKIMPETGQEKVLPPFGIWIVRLSAAGNF